MNQPSRIVFAGMGKRKPKPPAGKPKPTPPKVPLPGYPERIGLDEPTIWKGKPKPAPGGRMGLALARAVRPR